jgi:hypothetical protein
MQITVKLVFNGNDWILYYCYQKLKLCRFVMFLCFCSDLQLTRKNCFRYLNLCLPLMKILFKKQLFDLKVKVSRRSSRYATHRLMVMHQHTKYNWPIWKDKKLWSGQASLRRSRRKNQTKTICLPSFEGET